MGYTIENKVLTEYTEDEFTDEVIIPDGMARIDPYTFLGCSNLRRVTLPDSGIEIADTAFNACPCGQQAVNKS